MIKAMTAAQANRAAGVAPAFELAATLIRLVPERADEMRAAMTEVFDEAFDERKED